MNSIYAVILGDLVGQPYECKLKENVPIKDNVIIYNDRTRITDDSIMTIAACEYLIQQTKEKSIEYFFKKHALENVGCGFGSGFKKWINTPLETIGNSWGNGSVMRISPFILLKDLKGLCDSINTSHSHIISLKAAINLYELYHQPKKKEELFQIDQFEKMELKSDITLSTVYKVFNNTKSTHEAIKLAVSLGGDTDTIASIVAGLSAYHYNDITEKDIAYVNSKLTQSQKEIILKFIRLYNN